MDDDLEVVRRVLAGDRESFRELVHRYEQPLFAFVRNLTTDGHDWEDIVQDVFLAAYSRLHSFDPRRAALSTWLFTIARNKALNAVAKKRPLTGLPELDTADTRAGAADAADEELFGRLDAALASLPTEQKAAFVLAEIQEVPLAEVARIERVKLGTIKSRVSRAKEKLRAFFCQTAGK